MQLKDILQGVAPTRILGPESVEVGTLGFDSRKAAPGMAFFALKGEASDGHDYMEAAASAGVAAIVCERLPENPHAGVTYVLTPDSHLTMGIMARNFHGDPSSKLKLVGVTGTNGKTTVATLLYDLFGKLGYKTGLVSTVKYMVAGKAEEATRTTPDVLRLNELISRMVDAGCDYCFMEVSSHSVVQRRIAGLTFAGGMFTNITLDHLDYHKTMAAYIKAKKGFFDSLPKEAFALVNGDDRNGQVMLQNCKAKKHTFALRTPADFKGRIVDQRIDGMLLELDRTEVWVRFIGRFNASNLLAVYAAALLLGADKTEVLTTLSVLTPPDGRLEFFNSENGVTAVVDYAHTPDALKNVIDTLSEVKGGGRLIVVAGCGGNRDASKRPLMAKIAAEGGDMAILTSDNPRKEDPDEILRQMEAGIPVERRNRVMIISNRKEAIRAAAMYAKKDDIILVAGKGHENYQEINGIRHHFDDREEVAEALKIR